MGGNPVPARVAMEVKLGPKQRGFALATSGLALALAVIALLEAIGFVHVGLAGWRVTAGAVVLTVGSAWLLLELAQPFWARWDPHFVFLPSIATALLLSELIWAAPEVRMLVLVVWPVVLIFLAGYVDFAQGALLSGLMTAGYVTAIALARPPGVRMGVEAIVAAVFFITCLFADVVLAALKRQRQALIDARAELGRLVATDALTGLPNRRHFQESLDAEMARVQRYGGTFCLALLDLDSFKGFNDRYGHPAGDAVLCELGRTIRQHMRASDRVARLGGEEFAIILVGTGREAAQRVMERLRASVEALDLSHLAEPGCTVTTSIGVAAAPDDAEYPGELVRRADEALYEAKARGRNCVALWEGGAEVRLAGRRHGASLQGETR
jgi:diguanylate cyclase (GGDEF)-like protein